MEEELRIFSVGCVLLAENYLQAMWTIFNGWMEDYGSHDPYMVWQFNSWNGPVKARFAYLCTSGCCRLRNTLLVKLCTSWDYGASAGNSLENHFPEYLTVTFSRCVGYQKGQQIFVLKLNGIHPNVFKDKIQGLHQSNTSYLF